MSKKAKVQGNGVAATKQPKRNAGQSAEAAAPAATATPAEQPEAPAGINRAGIVPPSVDEAIQEARRKAGILVVRTRSGQLPGGGDSTAPLPPAPPSETPEWAKKIVSDDPVNQPVPLE